MASTKPKIVIRTEKNIIDKFLYIAKKNNRSMSNLGETVILDYINNYETENGNIKIQNVNIEDNNGTINF